tara:strand:- start:539 stop:1090 length:552 start_codon:yes stop_codon:yes gene_type:complete
MIFSKTIRLIKTIQEKNFRQEVLLPDDVSFLLSCIENPHSDSVYTAALIALTESDNNVLDTLMKRFLFLQDQAQMLAIPMLATTDYVVCYTFLLELLKESDNLDKVAMIAMVLSSTHYLVVPIMVNELISDDAVYCDRLGSVFKLIGFKKVAKYLILHPQIPFESFFRNLFGNEKIDFIKQKK